MKHRWTGCGFNGTFRGSGLHQLLVGQPAEVNQQHAQVGRSHFVLPVGRVPVFRGHLRQRVFHKSNILLTEEQFVAIVWILDNGEFHQEPVIVKREKLFRERNQDAINGKNFLLQMDLMRNRKIKGLRF
ncbi:hypothetical protein ACO2Q8_08260 [Larkinella sp. VNQ87]|uniref:hypothetical protein n=1 Tax=Larkinella sp. VNQ87 TaxID=3400921 RepID=UPI003C059FA3